MHCGPDKGVYTACYPSKSSKALRVAGIALIVTGMILIILCVPLWAWLALVGAALILVGVLLLRK